MFIANVYYRGEQGKSRVVIALVWFLRVLTVGESGGRDSLARGFRVCPVGARPGSF